MNIIGMILIVIGVICGMYVGIWWAFVGGVLEIIEAIRTPGPLDEMAVIIGGAKAVFSGLIGYGIACVFIIPGITFLK